MSEREVGGACGEREGDRPGRPAHAEEEQGDDGGQEELGRSLPRLPQVGVDAAVSLSESPERHLPEHDSHGEAHRAEDGPAHLVGEHDGDRNEQARLVERDGRGIDAGEARDDRHTAVPERKGVAGMQPAVQELADVVQRERVERVELADAAEVHESVAGQDVVDRPQRTAEDQPRRADGEADEAHARRHDLTRSDGPNDEDDKRSRANRKSEGDGEVERGAEGEREREPAADERDRPGERGRQRPLPEAARHEPAGQEEHDGRGREPQPEAEAGLRAAGARSRATLHHRPPREAAGGRAVPSSSRFRLGAVHSLPGDDRGHPAARLRG